MAKKKKEKHESTGTAETMATINQIIVKPHEDDISFAANFNKEADSILRKIIKDESPVAIVIDLPTPPDPQFPAIRVEGNLKSLKLSKTVDNPKITNVQFSSDQVQQLTNYIRNEQELKLRFIQLQADLPFDEEESTESTSREDK